MLDPISVAYGEIRGMFSAFALLTLDDENLSYTFDFEHLEKQKTVQATIELHTTNWAETVTLLPLTDWKKTFQTIFKSWLTDKLAFPLWYERALFDKDIERLITKIELLVQPTTVWQVSIKEKKFYELWWVDFALENDNAVFFLHLGFSD